MTDCISREAAIALTDQHCFESIYDAQWMEDELRDLPPVDVVEVVRCKDCKNFIENPNDCISGYGLTGPEPMDFCPYGERRG